MNGRLEHTRVDGYCSDYPFKVICWAPWTVSKVGGLRKRGTNKCQALSYQQPGLQQTGLSK